MNATATPETSALADVVFAAATLKAAAPTPRASFYVALNCLSLSPDQVRQNPPSVQGIAEMAAMLAAQGQLCALQVIPDTTASPVHGETAGEGVARYFVCAGGRRLRGFLLLAEQGKIAADFAVECKVLEVADALSVGLMENISQEAMHPADEFAAFKALIDQGRTTQSIATQYGATVLHVQRRLKLASLAPELMKLYRKGDMQLDQVMAMAALDDPKRQVMLYRSLPNHSRTAQAIRRLIAQDDVSHQDPRVKLVGLPTYLAAWGGLREDLFSENAERFLTDPLLLEMLVAEAFEVQASSLRAQGWKWVDVLPEFTYTERGQYFAMPTKRLPESPVHLATRLTLAAQLSQLQDRLVECAQGEEVDEAEIDALEEKVEAVDQQLQALDAQRVDTSARDKALAGVVLMLEGSKIKPLENMGRVSERKQIMAALAVRQQGSAGRSDSPQTANTPQEGGTLGEDSQAKPDDEKNGLPERLMLNLTAHRTAALQASMLGQHKVTLAALALHMACGLFDSYAAHRSPLKINCTNPWYALERHSPTVGNSPAAHVLAEERARWTALLPQDKGQWLQWFIDQPLEVSLSMVVLGTAQTVDAVQGRTPSQDPAKSLAGALGLDMVQWWSPTPDNYLSLVPKSELTQAVTQARGTQRAAEIAKLKKPEAIAFAARALEGSGWLPEPLRSA